MSSFQRTVKYIAMGFAIVLAIGIVSGIVNIAFALVSVITGNIPGSHGGKADYSETFAQVRSLDVDNSTGKLIIRTGDAFKVEAENVSDSFKAEMTDEGTLKISDDSHGFQIFWFHFGGFNSPNSKITVYLPADFTAEKTDISSGAGSVSMNSLHTQELKISAGAGSISGNDMSAGKVKIEGGFGSISLSDVDFADSDLSCGAGSVTINGVISGDSRIECGLGGVSLNLNGNEEDYDLDINSGIGGVNFNGRKVSNDYKTDNNADNSLKIDGGIGSVSININ